VSPSTLMAPKLSPLAERSAPRSMVSSVARSVVMKASIVARSGWIIPAPLAMPPMRTRP
jgi:hypothetical protein